VRVSSEYPELTRRYFERHGIEADIQLSYGATEAKVPDIVDVIVDITETGRALRAAGLKIIDTILTSYTELVANPASFADPAKRHAMQQIKTLLDGVLDARGKVLVKLNVATDALEKVIGLIPAMKAPTVNELYGGQGYAVEAVVPKSEINVLIPALKDAGASDILELPIAKIVPERGSFPDSARRVMVSIGEVRFGTVAEYDDAAGYGELADPAGERWWFHCTAIVDGSRTVAVGTSVRFRLQPGHLGRYEAADVNPV
jgi:ATP phosphoribosyltransferase-like protein